MTVHAKTAAHAITLTIDGQQVAAREGQTILEVARERGISIPTLCQLDGLSAWGGCRLCLVEVAGQHKLPAACVTPCTEGMVVQTDTDRLQSYRRTITEMLFSERNHVCAVCVSNGHCELQSVAQTLEVDHVNLPYRFPHLAVDSSHERFRLDHNRCILCTRCVRVCSEIEGASTKGVAGRGIEAMIITDMGDAWGDSETCTSCGKCVHVCPTGALSENDASPSLMQKQRQFLPYLTAMRGEDGNA